MRGDRFADFRGLRHRKADRQRRTGAVLPATGLDPPALRLDKAAADRQPETGAGAPAILRLDAIELVEDAFEIARRDARPLIDDLDPGNIAVAPGPQVDAAAGRRIFGGVVEQIEQHLLDEDRVEPQHRQIGGDGDFDAMPGENFASSPYGRADDVAQVEEIEAQLDRAGFEAGHVEQIADEAVEALGFV